MKKINVIVTGATGMVGEGVLHQCLNDERIEKVLVVGRRSCGVVHEKLSEIIHQDFFNLSHIASQLKGYDACLFCLGTTSVGKKEKEFYHDGVDCDSELEDLSAEEKKKVLLKRL